MTKNKLLTAKNFDKAYKEIKKQIKEDKNGTLTVPPRKRGRPRKKVDEFEIITNPDLARNIDRQRLLQAAREVGVVSAKPAPGESARPGDTDEKGFKVDAGKLRLDMIPPECLEELGRIFSHGSQKYPPYNWRKGMAWSRPYGAALRHIMAWAKGESVDKDSGCAHLSHAVWNLFVLQRYESLCPEKNDIVMELKGNFQEALKVAEEARGKK